MQPEVRREMSIVMAGNKMVRLARFERTTACLEGRCSIQLSYRRTLLNTGAQGLCKIKTNPACSIRDLLCPLARKGQAHPNAEGRCDFPQTL